MNYAFAREANQALSKMTPWQKFKMRYRGKKIYLGHEKRENWSGFLPFYLFWCEDCQHYAKDYPHGFIERQYLTCSHCGIHHHFVPWWVGWVRAWQMLGIAIRYRLGRLP